MRKVISVILAVLCLAGALCSCGRKAPEKIATRSRTAIRTIYGKPGLNHHFFWDVVREDGTIDGYEICTTEKTVGGVRCIYAAVYWLPSVLLRRLLEESGIFLYSREPLVYTYANRAFLGVYNATDVDAAVSVPEDGTWRDMISGETFRSENGTLTLPRRELRAYLLCNDGK